MIDEHWANDEIVVNESLESQERKKERYRKKVSFLYEAAAK